MGIALVLGGIGLFLLACALVAACPKDKDCKKCDRHWLCTNQPKDG